MWGGGGCIYNPPTLDYATTATNTQTTCYYT